MRIIKILVKLFIVILLFLLVSCGIIYTCSSEHNEFLNSTFLESRKYISTDGPYFLLKNNYAEKISVEQHKKDYVIEVDSLDFFETYKKKHNVSVFSYDNIKNDCFDIVLNKKTEIPKWNWDMPSKIIAISDIEGNWFAFKKLLINSNVIDEDFNWIFQDGHLVLVGDFVDRGLNVTQILWLIYKLEVDAVEHGGKVHFLLGNHEVMNLHNQLHHVRSKYIKLSNKLGLDYSSDLLGNNSILGNWLRTKNSVEKIGNYLFVHGGIGTELFKYRLSIDSINNYIRKYNTNTLVLNSPLIDDFILGKNGPLWYRGYIRDTQDSVSMYLDDILNFYEAKKVIVGHSTVSSIETFFNKKIIDIDVHFPYNSKDKIIGECLLIKNERFFVIDTNGKIRELDE